MITIQRIDGSRYGKAVVRFSMPEIEGCHCLYLVGWFGEWTEGVYQMAPARDGGWYLERELGTGREYQYCFRAIDGRWFSDATPTPIALDAPVRSSFVIDSEVWV